MTKDQLPATQLRHISVTPSPVMFSAIIKCDLCHCSSHYPSIKASSETQALVLAALDAGKRGWWYRTESGGFNGARVHCPECVKATEGGAS